MSTANSLQRMPSKELSKEQLADADRLMAAFGQWQHQERLAGRPSSQEAALEELGFGQSALSQYLNGKIPLNAKALAKFCRFLAVTAHSISPSIAEAEAARLERWNELSPTAREVERKYDVRPLRAAKAWPFRMIKRAEIDELTAPMLAKLEVTMRHRLDELVELRGGTSSKANAR